LADWSWSGVPAGTGATNGSPSSSVNVPRGWVRWIVIAPLASSVSIPEICLALPAASSSAPTIEL